MKIFEKDNKNIQRRIDSSQTYLWKRIPRNRQRLWNQISKRDSEQGVELMLGYRLLNNRMVEIRDEGGNCKIFYHMRRAAIDIGLSN